MKVLRVERDHASTGRLGQVRRGFAPPPGGAGCCLIGTNPGHVSAAAETLYAGRLLVGSHWVPDVCSRCTASFCFGVRVRDSESRSLDDTVALAVVSGAASQQEGWGFDSRSGTFVLSLCLRGFSLRVLRACEVNWELWLVCRWEWEFLLLWICFVKKLIITKDSAYLIWK